MRESAGLGAQWPCFKPCLYPLGIYLTSLDLSLLLWAMGSLRLIQDWLYCISRLFAWRTLSSQNLLQMEYFHRVQMLGLPVPLPIHAAWLPLGWWHPGFIHLSEDPGRYQ